ncbi:endonuclease/exonuclease/phosphatase family protein [Halosquirtibacter laminarini]|uniref:Endonuclease/exonuclease/phosphatase family protein n=1 Tax=Halosquirtibacter laminarini TaxID=3374600 RepID=A0AC61NHU5_9BACT|nr:endonuclease/exonuclease/phosphatase family protein [Prolixibacteraceae bacterium]
MAFKTLFLVLSFLCLYVQAQPKQDKEIRIMTYNIHHGADSDGKLNLSNIGSIIQENNLDIVFLQEVDYNVSRSGNKNQSLLLGAQTQLMPLFGKAISLNRGAYGVALLSKYNVLKSEVHKLPHTSSTEQRVALESILALPCGKRIRVINAHLTHVSETLRSKQLAYIQKLVHDEIPTILSGDLNALPQEVRKNMPQWKFTNKAKDTTYPALNPQDKIDYILIDSPHNWHVISSKVVDRPEASDHLPLISVLKLN